MECLNCGKKKAAVPSLPPKVSMSIYQLPKGWMLIDGGGTFCCETCAKLWRRKKFEEKQKDCLHNKAHVFDSLLSASLSRSVYRCGECDLPGRLNGEGTFEIDVYLGYPKDE
jgi:hypothetical protein